MKTATFENTVDILVKAYLNDTLKRGSCMACAVGNIISGNGYNLKCNPAYTSWYEKIVEGGCYWSGNEQEANRQISATGYTELQLAKIEVAFEQFDMEAETHNEIMFNGLIRVVDQLAIIHNVDLSVRESAKQLFVKA